MHASIKGGCKITHSNVDQQVATCMYALPVCWGYVEAALVGPLQRKVQCVGSSGPSSARHQHRHHDDMARPIITIAGSI